MPRSKKSRRQITAYGNSLIDLARRKHPELVTSAATSPLEFVESWPGISVSYVDESSIAGNCSVSGAYFFQDRRILVSRSTSRRRRYFTALHELAHDLQEHSDEFIELLEGEPDAGVALEDDICDSFAAGFLIPDELVDDAVGPKGPTAESVIELFERSRASREACCVRAAQKIRGDGYVMLCGLDLVAQFTAATTPYRVRRNTSQRESEVIEAAGRWGRAKRESRVCFASGAKSQRFFGHAMKDGDYIYAVFVSYQPAWEKGLSPTLSEPNYPLGADQGD